MAKPRIYWDNRLADTYLQASSTAPDVPAAPGVAALKYHPDHVADWRPYTWWKPVTLPATLTVDSDEPRSCDSLFVLGHNLASCGCTMEVRGSTDDFGSSDVLVFSITPASDAPFARVFELATYRYSRIRITGTTPPSLNLIALGMMLELDGYADIDPLQQSLEGVTNRNLRGRPLGKVWDYVEWRQRVQIEACDFDWCRDTFVPVWNAGLRARPFGFQWNVGVDPEPRLVVAGDDLSADPQGNNQVNLQFDVSGALE